MRAQRPHTEWSPVAARVEGLVRPVPLDDSGRHGPTRGQAVGPDWVRTSHGWYVPIDAPRHLVEQRILEQSVRLPRCGAVTGWAALRLLGGNYFDGLDPDGGSLPVPLAIGPHRSIGTSSRIVAANHVLLPEDRTTAYGVPVARASRALYDAVRLGPGLRAGVRAIDMAAAAGLCSLAMLHEYADRQPQDSRQVTRALALASEHARSPIEVDLRLICLLDVGLSSIEVNCLIHDRDGRVVAEADVLDVEAGAVYEGDGGHHAGRRQTAQDLRRTDVLNQLGLEVGRVTGREMRNRRLVAERIRLTRSRSRFEPLADRAWFFTRKPAVLDERLRGSRESAPGA